MTGHLVTGCGMYRICGGSSDESSASETLLPQLVEGICGCCGGKIQAMHVRAHAHALNMGKILRILREACSPLEPQGFHLRRICFQPSAILRNILRNACGPMDCGHTNPPQAWEHHQITHQIMTSCEISHTREGSVCLERH